MPNIVLEILFWISIIMLGYVYAGYPILILGLSKLFPKKINQSTFDGKISVVIVVYNEAARLKAKLDSIFACDRSDQIIEVLIGSDGSDDDTSKVLEEYSDKRVRLIHFSDRRGKPSVLNDVVTQTTGDVVLLTDARQAIDKPAIGMLVDNFSDENIGVVSGELVLRAAGSESTAAAGIGAYWKYEKMIRNAEGRFQSVPGATGAFYAIRRELFKAIPSETLLDDVVIPMQAVTQGKRCIFESGAFAFDEPSQSTKQESIRKRRTIAGNAQLVLLNPQWLLPWKNPIWIQFLSHKLGRLICPLFLILAFITNVLLLQNPIYQIMFGLQILFYSAAVLGWLLQKFGKKSKVLGLFLMFVSLNTTTVFALWDAARGRFRATWKRAA